MNLLGENVCICLISIYKYNFRVCYTTWQFSPEYRDHSPLNILACLSRSREHLLDSYKTTVLPKIIRNNFIMSANIQSTFKYPPSCPKNVFYTFFLSQKSIWANVLHLVFVSLWSLLVMKSLSLFSWDIGV